MYQLNLLANSEKQVRHTWRPALDSCRGLLGVLDEAVRGADAGDVPVEDVLGRHLVLVRDGLDGEVLVAELDAVGVDLVGHLGPQTVPVRLVAEEPEPAQDDEHQLDVVVPQPVVARRCDVALAEVRALALDVQLDVQRKTSDDAGELPADELRYLVHACAHGTSILLMPCNIGKLRIVKKGIMESSSWTGDQATDAMLDFFHSIGGDHTNHALHVAPVDLADRLLNCTSGLDQHATKGWLLLLRAIAHDYLQASYS